MRADIATQGVQGCHQLQPSTSESSPEICAAYGNVPTISIDIHQAPCETAFFGANNYYAGHAGRRRASAKRSRPRTDCKYDRSSPLEIAGGRCRQRRPHRRDARRLRQRAAAPSTKPRSSTRTAGGTVEARPGQMNDVLPTLAPAASPSSSASTTTWPSVRSRAMQPAGRATASCASLRRVPTRRRWKEIACNPNWLADTAYFPERYGRTVVPAIIDILDGQGGPSDLHAAHRDHQGQHPRGLSGDTRPASVGGSSPSRER